MDTRYLTSKGVILSRKNYSESDRLITVFSEFSGKVTLLAKGVRRIKSRRRGHLEIFGNIKFSAKRHGNFMLLTEAENIENFAPIRVDLARVAVAYFMVEVVEKITSYGEKNAGFYRMLTDYLNALTTSKNLKKLRLTYVRDILTEAGFLPYGENVPDLDKFLESVIERKMISSVIGKKILGG